MDERKKVIEDVDKDRRYAIDAAIVRIMKSRKVLGHQQLVMECVEQLGRMFKVLHILSPFDIQKIVGPFRVSQTMRLSFSSSIVLLLILFLKYAA